METVPEKVHHIIKNIVLEGTGMEIELSNDLSLINDGILDSLTIVDVVRRLQMQFGIEVAVEDMTVANFDSVGLITDFVKSKLIND